MLAMLVLTFAAVAGAAHLKLAEVESPIARVITLLDDLKTQVQEEGTAEAETYDKFACFCKEKTTEKVDSIAAKEDDIMLLTADIAQGNALIAETSAEIVTLQNDISTLEADIAEMAKIRDEEKAVYEVEYADATAAVSALNAAIKHIGDSKSLVGVKAEVKKVVALADALNVHMKGNKKITALIQQIPDMDATMPEEDYEFHSDGITDILNNLLTEFDARKTKVSTEEEDAVTLYDETSTLKNEELEGAKTSLSTKETLLSDTQASLAQSTEELTETTALRNDDQTYLKDITGQCETKGKEWDQRSTARSGEITALTKALEIMGVAEEKAAASGNGGRTAPEGAAAEEAPAEGKLLITTKKEAMHPQGVAKSAVKPAAKSAVKPAAKPAAKPAVKPAAKLISKKQALISTDEDQDLYTDVVFFQTTNDESAAQLKLRNRAVSALKASSLKLKSEVLASIVLKVAADPFAKVKDLVQGLIQRLLQEAADEATQKGWCDTEMGKANKTRTFRQGDAESGTANIHGLEAHKAKLEESQATLTEELAQLETDIAEAATNRDSEKANNAKTLTDAGEGLVAIKQAITTLKDFYRKAGRNKVLLDASPVGADMADAGVTGGAAGAYKGNQDAATGIIGMLATIQSDFERTLKDTEAAEHQAGRDYAKFDQEAKVSRATKTRGLEQTSNDLSMTSGALVQALNDLRENQELLDKSLKTLEVLRPACVDTGMSFEERVERREAEIEALKGALEILSEGEGFFLQKK